MNGPYIEFYPNGDTLLKTQYSNGVLSGIFTKYYASGQIEETVTFANNDENGPFYEYYENGILHWEGSYLNGDNEFGLLTEYNTEGVILKKMMCDSLAMCRSIWTLEKGDIK